MEPPIGRGPYKVPAPQAPLPAPIAETKPLSKEDGLFLEAISAQNEAEIAELTRKKLLPSKELIVRAIEKNMSRVAMRALQANPQLTPEELFEIRGQAYAAKDEQLVVATLQRGSLPSSRELEKAMHDRKYALLDKLLEPYRALAPKPNLYAQEGDHLHLILYAISDYHEKAFDLLKDVVDLDVKVGTMSLLEYCLQLSAEKNSFCLTLCLQALCNAQERRTQSERDAYAMYLFGTPELKAFFEKLYIGLPYCDPTKKDNLVHKFISLCGREARWNALCTGQNCILDTILHFGDGVKIAQMLLQDDPNLENRDESGGTLLHHFAEHADPDLFITLIGWARENGINLASALDIKRSTDQKTASDVALTADGNFRQIPLDLLRFESESPRSGNDLLQFINALPKYEGVSFQRAIRFPLLKLAQSRGASLLQDANVVNEAFESDDIKILTLIALEQKQKGIRPDYKDCEQNLAKLVRLIYDVHGWLRDQIFAAETTGLLLLVDQFVGLDPLFESEKLLEKLLRLCLDCAGGDECQKLFEIAAAKNKKAMLFTCMLNCQPTVLSFEDLRIAAMVQSDPDTFFPILLMRNHFIPYALRCCLDGFLKWEGRKSVLSPEFLVRVLYAEGPFCRAEFAITSVLQDYLQQGGALALPQPFRLWPQGTKLSRIAVFVGLFGPATILLGEEKQRGIEPDPLQFFEKMTTFERFVKEGDPQRWKGEFLYLWLERFFGWKAVFESHRSINYVLGKLPPEIRGETLVFLSQVTENENQKTVWRQALESFVNKEPSEKIILSTLAPLFSRQPELFVSFLNSNVGAKLVGRYFLDRFLAWDGNKSCSLKYLMAHVLDNYTESDPCFRQCLQLAMETNCDFNDSGAPEEMPYVDLVAHAYNMGCYESCFAMQRALCARGTPRVNFVTLVLSHVNPEIHKQYHYFIRSLPSLKRALALVPDDEACDNGLFADEVERILSLEERIAFWWEWGEFSGKSVILPDTLTLEDMDNLFTKIQAIEPAFPLKALVCHLVHANPQFFRTLLASKQGAALVGSYLPGEFLRWDGNKSVDLTHLLVHAFNSVFLHDMFLKLAIQVGYNFGAELQEAGGKSLLALAIEKQYTAVFFEMIDALRAQGNLPPHFGTMPADIWRVGPNSIDRLQRYLRALPSLKRVVAKISPGTDLSAMLFTEEFQAKLSLEERIALFWELGNFQEVRRLASDLSAKELEVKLYQIKKIEPKFSVELLISEERLTENPRLFVPLLGSEQGATIVGRKYLDALLRWDGAKNCDLTRLMPYVIENYAESDPRFKEYLALAIQSDCNFSAKDAAGRTTCQLALGNGYFESYFAMQRALIAQGRPNRNFGAETVPVLKNISWLAAFKKYIQSLPSLQRVADLPDLDRHVLGGTIAQKLLQEEYIAFNWELGKDVRDIASSATLEAAVQQFIKIRKIEPAFSLSDLIAPEINPTHFARPVPEIKIPKAPPGIDMFDLLNLFDAAAAGGHITEAKLQSALKLLVSDKKKEGVEDLRPFLELYLERVKGRVAFHGTPSENKPEALEAYYQKIENCLKVITDILRTEESEQIKADVVVDLAVAGSYCGGRYFKEPKEDYSALRFDPEAANIVGLALVIAQRFRSNIVKHLAKILAAYEGATGHAEDYILGRLEKPRGVPGPEFPDPFATIQSLREPHDDAQLIRFFDEYYKSLELVDAFVVDFNGAKSEQKELLLEWFKDHVPDWYERELYEPILKTLSTMKHDTPEQMKQISQFLDEKGIASSWTGLDPQDAITSAKQVLSKELRTHVNFHIISLVVDQKNIGEAEALFVKYGIQPPEDFTNIAHVRKPLTNLIDKMIEEMLYEHQKAIKEMEAQGKSREELKTYLDSVTLKYTGLIRVEKKDATKKPMKDDQGQTMYDIVPGEVKLLTLGDYFPRQRPTPASFVQNARAQSFINNFLDKNGKFSSGMMVYFLLQNNLLLLPIAP